MPTIKDREDFKRVQKNYKKIIKVFEKDE
ncbi:hypothetical protein LCGC14_2987460, partial [marine sediment metagenome]